jgi:hypothetical protein
LQFSTNRGNLNFQLALEVSFTEWLLRGISDRGKIPANDCNDAKALTEIVLPSALLHDLEIKFFHRTKSSANYLFLSFNISSMKETEHVKVLFRFYSNVLGQETVETMWAIVLDKAAGLYQLDSIPFYAPMASDDIIFAEFDDEEQFLTYRRIVEYSENSTVQVVLIDKIADVNVIRDAFRTLGCLSETCNARYFSMEIPKEIAYSPIKARLDEMELNEIIAYAEPRLSARHCY